MLIYFQYKIEKQTYKHLYKEQIHKFSSTEKEKYSTKIWLEVA